MRCACVCACGQHPRHSIHTRGVVYGCTFDRSVSVCRRVTPLRRRRGSQVAAWCAPRFLLCVFVVVHCLNCQFCFVSHFIRYVLIIVCSCACVYVCVCLLTFFSLMCSQGRSRVMRRRYATLPLFCLLPVLLLCIILCTVLFVYSCRVHVCLHTDFVSLACIPSNLVYTCTHVVFMFLRCRKRARASRVWHLCLAFCRWRRARRHCALGTSLSLFLLCCCIGVLCKPRLSFALCEACYVCWRVCVRVLFVFLFLTRMVYRRSSCCSIQSSAGPPAFFGLVVDSVVQSKEKHVNFRRLLYLTTYFFSFVIVIL